MNTKTTLPGNTTQPSKTPMSKTDEPIEDEIEDEEDEPDSVSYVEFAELMPQLAQTVAQAVVAALLPILNGDKSAGVTKALLTHQDNSANLQLEARQLIGTCHI
jgi:hypothetical protein